MHRPANLRAGGERQEAKRGTTKSTALFPGAARSCSFAFNGRKNERGINREQCA
jgi:hypothetical protein